MNVNAAGRVPAHVHRPAVTPTEDAVSEETAPTDGTSDAPVDDERSRPGGSDTPFTHALHQGNGKKLGILRRMPSPDEVAAEQTAAGLDPTGGEVAAGDGADGTDEVAPTDGTGDEVTGEVPVDDTTDTAPVEGDTIAIDGSELGTDGTLLAPVDEEPTVEELLAEAVEEASKDAEETAEDATTEQVVTAG